MKLDEALATRLASVFDLERPPETVAGFTDGMVGATEAALGRPLGLDDLCVTDDSPHMARVGEATRHYECVLDAFVLGTALDDPVTVETTSPVSGEAASVEFAADGTVSGVTAPSDAVMSFGVPGSVEPPEGAITLEAVYARVCGYSHVFASREEYETWDEDTEAVTQTWPLAEGLAIADEMVEVARPLSGTDGPCSGENCC